MKLKNQEMLLTYIEETPIKVIALDLDRTTLRSDSTLAPRTRTAICDALAAGLEVVVISGRPRCSLPQEVLEIPGIRYLVTSNGAAVNKRYYRHENRSAWQVCAAKQDYELLEEKRIWAWTLAEEAALAILKYSLPYFEKELLTYETFVEGIAYAPEDYVNHPSKYGAPKKAEVYVKSTRIPITDFPDFIREHAHELDSLDLLVADLDYFEEIQELIQSNVADVYMTSSMKRMLEISNKEAGKASGLRYVLEDMGLRAEQVVAFGDGNNDADMLAYAGLGVAMANAMPLCRENADYIGKSNDEDGVAEIIELILSARLNNGKKRNDNELRNV